MDKIGKVLEKANVADLQGWKPLDSNIDKNDKGVVKRDSGVIESISKKQTPEQSSDTLEGPVDFRIVVYHNPESLAAEHFKVLRSSIMYPPDGREIKSVLVTSALEQEGKTMVSCNLAVSIAQSVDPYVLLIDGDVRRPSVQKTLGLRKSPGLTDYLLTGKPLSNFLMKGILDKMTVLQAGSTVRNPAELMTSDRMHQLIQEARDRYADRLIVIDSPPVNLAAETLVLSKHVDVVILVVRYGVSDKNAVEEAINKLGKQKILGVVFNGFEVKPRKYTYYKKSYYHTSY